MALYMGSKKVQINLDGFVCLLNLPTTTEPIVYKLLLSSDGYILQDSNGFYITVKEEE